MFNVHFFENNNLLLSQIRKTTPSIGEDLRIKGRKGKVINVNRIDENKIEVQINLESVNKNKPTVAVDNVKKKKR